MSVRRIGVQQPLYGIDDWRESGRLGPLPPPERRRPGRPKLKRDKSAGESLVSQGNTNTRKLGRAGLNGLCSVCKCPGHNKRRCKETQTSEAEKVVPKGNEGGGKKPRPGETSSMTINESQHVRKSPQGFSNAEDTSSLTINESQPLRRSPRGVSMDGNISSMNMNVSQSVCTSSRVLFKSIASNKKTKIIEHPISAGAGQKDKASKVLKKLPCKRSSNK